MSNGYTKLFSDIVDSSIWDEDAETCKVWVTLLALANPDGFVRGSVGWLASKARVSVAECEQAIASFLSPDPESRTPDNEGKRIEVVERGWLILNYLYFRNEHKQLSENPRRVYQREWMRKKRSQQSVNNSQHESTNVNCASASVHKDKGSVREKGVNAKSTDEQFINDLRANPAYSHIDVDRELNKMDAWLSTRPKRKKTRPFVVNWLNNADAPLAASKPDSFPQARDVL